eukprot:TRINITY_DN1001_c0_g1_i2.p1 TRINITY_DN1001_c0_g1~~TRINITY_DN1001_c0_g1_i2.p1  ORF type:complete len:376 (+),score=153.83 TRINITY_DN1001_c0_g1_i2:1340-2467(+)
MPDYAKVSQINYGQIPQLQRELEAARNHSQFIMLHESVKAEDIAKVISRATGIPLSNMLTTEREKLLKMESTLKQEVIGQDESIAAISNTIRVTRAGLNSHNRPLGSFLFLGPTGVGKTQLCKSLAKFLFDTDSAIIRIDMSEYMEKFSVSRLIGAPPGYVGYEEGGTLTEAVRRKPFSIVLFDEFEKAHREVSNLLLQVLDEGHLTDSQGRKVDFKNTIVIMTSNLGSDKFARLPEGEPSSAVKGEVMETVRGVFPPEFLNRIDDIVLFNRLSRENIIGIVDVQEKIVKETLDEQNIQIEFTPEAKKWLGEKGYDIAYGARPLKRLIQKEILYKLSNLILDQTVKEGDYVKVVVNPSKDELHFDVHTPELPKAI